jgi:hypothetical protein
MTRYAPLWQQAGSYPAALDRGLISSLWPSGGASGGAVTASATNMTVTAAPGAAAVPLQAGQGAALCRWDANEVPTLAAATHPAGQTRIDLVIVQVRDNALDAGANNDFIVTSVTGVPAASSPGVPATPTNALVLAQVVVPGAVANLSTATVTDLRGRALSMSSGIAGRAHATSAVPLTASTETVITPFATDYLRGGVRLAANASSLVVPVGGLYHCQVAVGSINAAGNAPVTGTTVVFLTLNGTDVRHMTLNVNGIFPVLLVGDLLHLAAGDAIGMTVSCGQTSYCDPGGGSQQASWISVYSVARDDP